MNHVMLDLETMGNGPRAAIVGIGAVLFDPFSGETGATFERYIDLNDSANYGEIDAGTVLWWLQQGQVARDKIASKPGDLGSLRGALLEFNRFIHEEVSDKGLVPVVWGNGATFDNVIITSAYQAIGSNRPWPYWNDRDVRTIVDLGRTLCGFDPKKELPFEGVAHTPLADALHQARYVSAIYQRLAGSHELADKLTPHPVIDINEVIRTAPERIWLQVGDEAHYCDEPFPTTAEGADQVTWCRDSVIGCEVPYLRADLAGKLPMFNIPLPANFKGHAVTLDELENMLNQAGISWAFTAEPSQQGSAA